MTTFSYHAHARTLLMASAALVLAGCGSNGHYRIASVGDVPGQGQTADGGSGSGSAES